MASANRCPQCKQTIHPFAALCPSCGTDLDAWRRQRASQAQRPPRVRVPTLGSDTFDLVVLGVVMVLLALFTPIIGALFALFIVWHAHHYGPVARRNLAIACVVLACFNLFDPTALLPHLIA